MIQPPATSTVDVVARAAACLEAAARPRGPSSAWDDAVRRVNAGDAAGAVLALAALDERARAVAALALQRLAVARGLPDSAIRAIGGPLQAKNVAGVGRDAVGWSWGRAWDAEVLPHLDVAALKGAAPSGYLAARQLQAAAERAVAAGDLAGAERLAEAIDAHHKVARAHAWCAIAAATPGVGAADLAWERAIKAAKQPPMIQDGGEEAEALASVVTALVDQRPPHHAAVAAAIAALLQLGKKRAPKDVRSNGICLAAAACARRASRDSTHAEAWMAHAEALLGSQIDDGRPVWAARILLAAAARARGSAAGEHRQLKAIGDPLFRDVREVRALFPERAERLHRHWASGASAFAEVALIREAGGDATKWLDAAVKSACVFAGGEERAFGELIAIAWAEAPRPPWSDAPRGPVETRAHALLQRPKTDRAAAFGAAALRLLVVDEDAARAWYVAALDAGWSGRWIASDVRWLRDRALRERVAALAAAQADLDDRAWALTDLAEAWWADGEIDQALGVVGLVTAGPATDAEPSWTPFAALEQVGPLYQVPAEPAEPPPPPPGAFAEGKDALKALKAAEQRDAWAVLGQRLVDPDELRQVRAALAKGKEQGAIGSTRHVRLVTLDLRLGDVDAALEDARGVDPQGHSSTGLAGVTLTIAEWLLRHPEAITEARVLAVIARFAEAHGQCTQERAPWVLPDLVESLPAAARANTLAAARALRDPVSGPTTVAVVLGHGGDLAGAASALRGAIGRAGNGGAETLACALARAERGGRLPGREAILAACLDALEGPRYKVIGAIERIARYLWLSDDVATLPPLVHACRLPDDAKTRARRSLVLGAPEHAPRPVDAVLAAWLDVAPNLDQAREQVDALARALAREGRTEAAAVRALLPP